MASDAGSYDWFGTIAGGEAAVEEKKERGASVCARCGQRFVCGMNAGAEKCWCAAFPPLFAVPDEGGAQAGCYCPACLEALVAERLGSAAWP
ncbi:hypothetical protein GRF61_01020 [Azoarcus sp. TTM-91]|uniref:cysteine-rich CWC family protein n=1 Tax=Azoarcus sp. TTM-91 TaxID=2691581 RepID=UPI00145ED496|nr:cysteine-rich CWC family protein [Azoarcus sp. TTM-91]NMG33029.1 hypothetical protein [Azoarcus sp. TTM-91]